MSPDRMSAQQEKKPVRLGIAGLSHDHVHWILREMNRKDVVVVGIYEPDRTLAERYASRFGFAMDIVYENLEVMLDTVQPEAVCAFGPVFAHRMVVVACAPRGIHVMVEKPLAVNMAHADVMAALSRQHHIHLLTNYETSWYASTHAAFEKVVMENKVGAIRRIVVNDGHQGPREIHCSEEFLVWLTDPVLNGGGAIVDFGCYGANLATWLMSGETPESVVAAAQTVKRDLYPRVDDQATIILNYPRAQAVIQASWNWPVSRKDMEIYGEKGYVVAADEATLFIRLGGEDAPEDVVELKPLSDARRDPFAYFAGVIRGEITVERGGLYSLENNLTVVKILDAARESANSGQRVVLKAGLQP
jgi:predicted dehydrogenase